MDKYAVELDEELTKTSSPSKGCAGCGGSCSPGHCSKYGTLPFEKRPTPSAPKPPTKK